MASNTRSPLNRQTELSAGLATATEISSTAVSQLTTQVGSLRQQAKFNHEDATTLHEQSLFSEWKVLTRDRGKTAPTTMLDRLSELGFAWRDVARMLGVSVAAVQKWRGGANVTGANRLKLASLLAVCDMLRDRCQVEEVASWFEMPVVQGVPITPIDFFAQDRVELVFDHAGYHTNDPEQTLTDFDPDWRERYRSDFEIFTASDGELMIRPKGK